MVVYCDHYSIQRYGSCTAAVETQIPVECKLAGLNLPAAFQGSTEMPVPAGLNNGRVTPRQPWKPGTFNPPGLHSTGIWVSHLRSTTASSLQLLLWLV